MYAWTFPPKKTHLLHVAPLRDPRRDAGGVVGDDGARRHRHTQAIGLEHPPCGWISGWGSLGQSLCHLDLGGHTYINTYIYRQIPPPHRMPSSFSLTRQDRLHGGAALVLVGPVRGAVRHRQDANADGACLGWVVGEKEGCQNGFMMGEGNKGWGVGGYRQTRCINVDRP